MKKIPLFGMLICSALFFLHCRTEQATVPTPITSDETPIELLAALDSLPDATGMNPDNILLSNGMTLKAYLEESDSVFAKAWLRNGDPYDGMSPGEAQVALIAKLTAAAWNLCHRPSHNYPNEGPDKPAQYGLGYSWGSKDTIRQKPPGNGAYCTHSIHGLDCSGFMSRIFKAAGVTLPEGPANLQRKIETLETAVHAASPSLANIQFEDFGSNPKAIDLRIGDILWWENDGTAYHIGIVLADWSGQKAVFQSIGRNLNSTTQCEENIGLLRGPRGIQYDDLSGNPINNHCHVLRPSTPLVCGCAGGSTLCNLPPSPSLIQLGLAGFNYTQGPGTKEEAKKILKALCADIQHEYTYSDGTVRVCGVFPNGYEITLWTPSYTLVNGYGARYGLVTDNHAYFGSNATYFEIVKP